MSEIQSHADPEHIKYFVGVLTLLVGVVNGLLFFIIGNFKKDYEKYKKRADQDHDRLNTIETKQNIYHPENNS